MADDATSDRNLRWLTLLLVGLVVVVGWRLWPAIVMAAWTAHLGRPVLRRLDHLLRGRKRAAATASILLFLMLAVPAILLAVGVVSGAQHLAATLAEAPSARSALAELTATGGPSAPIVPRTPDEFVQLAQRIGAQGFALGSRIADVLVEGLIVLFIYFAAVYSLLLHGEEGWAWLRRHVPLAPGHLTRFGRAFHETGRGLLLGVGLGTLTQGVVATVVYVLLDVPRAWVLGPLTGVASIIPVVGSALVWGPLVIGLLVGGEIGRAVVLSVLGVVVISSVDNLLRPVFSRLGALQLPMLLIFVSILGGVFAFGPNGAILGPLIVRLAKEALLLQHEATRVAHVDAGPSPPPPT